MKKLLMYIILGISFIIGVLRIIANFSAIESNFKCSGQVSLKNKNYPTTIYLQLEQYRRWVGLWSDSDASINLEIPNEWGEFYGYVKESGNQIHIFETYPDKVLKGNFSLLSKTLNIDLNSKIGTFEGSCTRIN